jgi:hypothetical protein
MLPVMVIWRCNKVRDGLVLKFGDGGELDSWRDVLELDFAAESPLCGI